MATMSRSETKKMYSWWWDSHISPKNSTWLKENLTDMDTKVRQMIKLIEVDEDSFARRAEMYYKKRPELMKLVEEFYRAYRALAERYDHATGILRQAHTTMAEAFPNQIPFSMVDDAPAGSVLDSGPRTPEITLPARASFDPDELHGDAKGLSPSDFHPGKRNGAKQLNGLFLPREAPNKLAERKVRKGLNFHKEEEKEQTAQNNSSEGQGKSETDIKALKEALAKLESEKLAGLLQYQKSLERLSNLELEVFRAQEDSKGYSERASKAEAEVLSLKEALEKLEAEREVNLLQYQQCLDRISNLESDISCAQEDAGQLNERASKAEKEVESLREELAQLKDEKETGLAKYMEALEKIANLDNKLLMAEDSASQASERADKAEEEVEALRQAIARLTEEKEAAALQYQKCLEKIAALERETALSQVEVERLKGEIDEGFAKLKGSEERCLMLERSNNSMQVILDSLTHQVGFQNEELAEKQKELGRLWACVQEERLRFAEAETTFQKLQNLHCQTQEELRSAAAELQKKVQLLKEMEIQNQHFQDEVEKFRDENKSLNDLYLSSAVSVKSMQDEIINLMEGKGKLEEELELRLDQRNALQQEIYCLKEELNDLRKKHQAVLEEVKSVGFDSECFGSSVIKLQNENSKLKENFQKSGADIAALVEKLAVMEKLVEKNALLENLLSDLSSELERAREKMKALEESCQLLMGENSKIFAEKTTLISQLEMTTENLEKLSERNTFLENSLSDANTELEALRVKSKNLEDSCWFLSDEKSILVTERQTLASQLEATCQRMEELGKIHAELEQKYSILEEERKSTLVAVQELHSSLAVEKQEHANSAQLNQMQLADMKNQICLLQEVREHTREELEVELDKAVNAQLEIFILSKYVRDLKETNSSLLNKCEKLLEASVLSQRLISELEHENLEQQEEVILLSDQIKRLRMGMFQVLKALKIDAGLECEDIANEDKMVLHHILSKLDDTKSSLFKAWDENQKLFIEKSVLMTLIGQLKHEVSDLKTLVNTLGQDFRIGNEQLSSLQQDTQKLLESNEELILRVREGNHREEVHAAEMKNLTAKLLDMQMACQNLEKENFRILSDERSLKKAVANLEEEKNKLEQDNSCLIAESVALGNISFFFKNFVLEKSADVEELSKNLSKLSSDNGVLEGLVTSLEGKLEKILMENMKLGVSLRATENELREVRTEKDQLEGELAKAKNVMCQRDGELLEAEAIKADQGKQIHELSDKYSKQLDECQQLQQSIQSLGAEVRRMHKEHEEAEVRLESLLSELQKGKDEVELWETVAGTFFCELQSSSVREALFKEKLSELNKSYGDLEIKSNLKDVEIVDLTERVEALAGENCQIKAQLAAYIPAISSLRDCVASLESHTALCTGFGQTDNEDKTDVESFQLSEEKVASELDMSVELMNAQIRIKAVEKAVVKMKRLAEEEYSNATSKLEAATRQIETLKSHSSSRRGSRSSRRFASQAEEEFGNGHIDGWRPRKPASDAFEACGELLMKDIMLDQVSECSSYRKTRRDAADTDDQILELWETIDQAGSIDLTVGRSHRAAASPNNMHFHLEAVKEHKSGRPSSESLVEKELGISKQENSRRFAEPFPEENKNKILERIASDIQKLTNLQITVQDLKKKVEITNNSGKGKSVDYDNTKEQLDETEKAILKLLEVDDRLMKNIESSSYFDGLSSVVYSAEGGSSRRRKVLEQARRCSEKIGRLQMDVQKIQFHLLKLNGEKAAKGGTRIAERNTRVLLRDYLYGGARTPRRRRKSRFCACVQPPTKGD